MTKVKTVRIDGPTRTHTFFLFPLVRTHTREILWRVILKPLRPLHDPHTLTHTLTHTTHTRPTRTCTPHGGGGL